MNTDPEAAAALAAAGLVASEIEGGPRPGPDAATAHASHAGAACRNCGAPLNGAFCRACGQAAHLHRSLLHLGEEVLHGLLHFDAKGWRTLPLLVARPGRLTRRYIDGQRVRYVSPLALFLFMVFLMFFVVSLTSSVPTMPAVGTAADRDEAVENVREADAAVARAEAEVAHARKTIGEAAEAESDLADARAEQRAARLALEAFDAAARAAAAASAASGAASSGAAAPPASITSAWATALRASTIDTGNASLDAAIGRAIANPELTLYKLKNTASKFSFMLVPISLPFLWVMFLGRRGVTLYDHAVFGLYSLSFMSLLFAVAALLAAAKLGLVAFWLVLLAVPVHMHLQLRDAYGLGRFATLWRTLALLVVSAVVFVVYLLFIVYLTMS